MKALILFLIACLCGCGSTRVLVRDCQDLAGMDDQKNCELVRKL